MSQIEEQREVFRKRPGFIAALDQSGGSTPKALAAYGIDESAWRDDAEMFSLVHQMRTRIMTSKAFDSSRIVAAILFEDTMERQIEGMATADYLWKEKQIVPVLKVDKGLTEVAQGVRLMKAIPRLSQALDHAIEKNIFGTKMRSVVLHDNLDGINAICDQQFALAREILEKGLVPILEPEVDIHCPEKEKAEVRLKAALLKRIPSIPDGKEVIFKLTIPSQKNAYSELIDHPKTLAVVALSGGYTRDEACRRLADQKGLSASFSRALAEGLSAQQSQEEFDSTLDASIRQIFEASVT
jgi:fructose-bisphosphate aldolase class I